MPQTCQCTGGKNGIAVCGTAPTDVINVIERAQLVRRIEVPSPTLNVYLRQNFCSILMTLYLGNVISLRSFSERRRPPYHDTNLEFLMEVFDWSHHCCADLLEDRDALSWERLKNIINTTHVIRVPMC